MQTVTELRASIDALREEQLEKALKQLERGGDAQEILRHLAHNLSNKILHTRPLLCARPAPMAA